MSELLRALIFCAGAVMAVAFACSAYDVWRDRCYEAKRRAIIRKREDERLLRDWLDGSTP